MEDVRILVSLLRELKAKGIRPCGGATEAECRRMMLKALENKKVKILTAEMKKYGCSFNPYKFFMAVDCKEIKAGGVFVPGKGIFVCCNHMKTQDNVNQVMIHELIHAYDECRVKNMDWKNCYHHACAEIRANVLSGDCHYIREYFRGYTNLRGQEPECVRRRATLSVRNNRNCSEYMTKMGIDAVWETCYNDKRPFDKGSNTP